MPNTLSAFAYLRVSGRGQVKGDGFPRQLAAIQEYAKQHGLHVADVFEERGVSGTADGMERPTWVEMITRILSNGVRTIIIEKLDRLARDLTIQEHIIADLKRRGIALVSVAEPDLCSDDPTRVLLRQIMGAIAEYDRRMTVLKLRGARARIRAQHGRCEGAKPFGELAGESAIVERIKALRSDGASYLAISTTLNAEGLKPRRGEAWHPFAVSRILARA